MKNIFKTIILLYLTFLVKTSHAENLHTDGGQIVNNIHEAPIIDQITGVYKKRFKNGFISGETYIAEDILEIVKINDNTIYFRTDLEFFNGHVCELYGTAVYKGDNLFLYENKEGLKCKLAIQVTEKDIYFIDGYADSHHCRDDHSGFRGGFDSTSFKRSLRKPIKYMNILKNSYEYNVSLEELKK